MIVELVVAANKKEVARAYARVEGGAVTARGAGPAADAADVVLTLTPADAEALRTGGLDVSVGFMRGQVKMAGDFGALLRLLSATPSSELASALPPTP